MKQKISSLLGIALSLILVSGAAAPAAAAESPAPSAAKMSWDVSQDLISNIPKGGLRPGSIEGEWTVMALARAGYHLPNVYQTYVQNVTDEVKNGKGVLADCKCTEASRTVLGLTAVGRDPRKIGGYNLLQPLADFDQVASQGINGPVWALIALDSGKYAMPQLQSAGKTQNSRKKMVDEILSEEIGRGTGSAGGWALDGSVPDPDITAMALEALSNYRARSDVCAAVDRAVHTLSAMQKDDGGYASWGAENPESTAQVIVALTSLGISPVRQDFVKSGHTLIGALSAYYLPGQGFRHSLSDSSANAMANDQCAYALAADLRFQANQNPLYNMTDGAPTASSWPFYPG